MTTMRTEAEWAALKEEHELAYLRGDLATSSPDSYTLDEMRAISAGMDESTARIDAAIREDFEQLPPEAQARMLELLAGADPGNMAFWNEILGLDMPDAPPVSA